MKPVHQARQTLRRRPTESWSALGAAVLLLGRVLGWDAELTSAVGIVALAGAPIITALVARLRGRHEAS